MGKPTGFLEFTRELPTKRSVEERVGDYKEFVNRYSDEKLNQQSGRCMDCGVPFCHNGCPLGNVIPEFNDAVYRKEWKEAYDILSSTNNFPEFTGRICPAPCETACVLGINQPPIANEEIEKFPSISKLARIAQMSGTKLKQRFKQVYGYRLYEFYNKQRLEKAKELISKGITPKEAGYSIGFSDVSNFTKAFKKEYGYTPGTLSEKATAQKQKQAL